jgi:sirohydrochlorin cobaltochelatase
MELPEAVERARARHPQVRFLVRKHLGMGPELFALIQCRLQEALRELDVPDPATTGVILLGRGSSDPGGNAELAKMTRWVFEANDHELVDLAFTGITWPRLETVVARQVRLGMMQIAIVPVYLFTGVLIERIGAQVERLRRQYPRVAFALARHFGFDERLVALLEARVGEEGREGMLECDGCKYRAAAAHEHAHAHHHG